MYPCIVQELVTAMKISNIYQNRLRKGCVYKKLNLPTRQHNFDYDQSTRTSLTAGWYQADSTHRIKHFQVNVMGLSWVLGLLMGLSLAFPGTVLGWPSHGTTDQRSLVLSSIQGYRGTVEIYQFNPRSIKDGGAHPVRGRQLSEIKIDHWLGPNNIIEVIPIIYF